MLRPPCILHINAKEDDDRMELIKLCSASLHFSKGERKLMEYYSSCSSGFRPSRQLTGEAINVSAQQVHKIRMSLCNKGIMRIENNRMYIDWERIRLFSTLDPRMTNKHCVVAPVRVEHDNRIVRFAKDCLSGQALALSTEELCDIFESFSEDEYERFNNYIHNHAVKMRT